MGFITGSSLFADSTRIENVPCEAAALVGHAVRMTSGGIAVRALADTFDNSNVIGIIESKAASTVCTVRFLGVTLDIYSGLDVTKEYYLSHITPGELTTSIPTGSGTIILKLGQPYNGSRFLVTKGTRTVRA